MMARFLSSWRLPRFGGQEVAEQADASPGVYVSLSELVAFEYRLRKLQGLAQAAPSHSLLAGRHRASRRGRGLDFEELREYLPGDDPRTIDWRVTARRGLAHVRIYNEERDRHHWLLVDQRTSMFFGRRRALRSQVAAQAAALLAWKSLCDGDRIGGLVLGDDGFDQVKPRRGRRSLLQLLARIVERNQALHAGLSPPSAAGQLNEALGQLSALAPRNGQVTIISDFAGFTERTRAALSDLARSNDVLLLPFWDPPGPTKNQRVVVSDGALQIEVDMGDKHLRERLADIADSRMQALLGLREQMGLAVVPLVTSDEVVVQVGKLLGIHACGGRGRR